MVGSDAIREALTPALLGGVMDPEVAALDGLPPPWMAVLDALVCCREHDYPATGADIFAWTATGSGPVHGLLLSALKGEGCPGKEAERRLSEWRWVAALVSPWPITGPVDPPAAARYLRESAAAKRELLRGLARAEAEYRLAAETAMVEAATRGVPVAAPRQGYAGAVHPGWAAVGRRQRPVEVQEEVVSRGPVLEDTELPPDGVGVREDQDAPCPP